MASAAPAMTTQQGQAVAAFIALVVEQLNPSLVAHTMPINGGAEYEIIVNGGSGGHGVVQEEIETVLRIAGEHGGRAFVHHAERDGDGCLCVVWPGRTPDGPDPEQVHDEQARQGRRTPRKAAS